MLAISKGREDACAGRPMMTDAEVWQWLRDAGAAAWATSDDVANYRAGYRVAAQISKER